MCGFCGYFKFDEKITNENNILNMTNSLKARGPNEQDTYIYENVALGHTRLSIIDVLGGSQPMKKIHDTNEYVIVYNGELYNTHALKNDLENKGYTFFSNSDTEVILTAYIEYKEKCVELLNGIFAFCVFDKARNSLFLTRDRLGIKPLFYTINKEDNAIIFSSEIKSILTYPGIKAVLGKDELMELIALGPAHTPGRTYFKDIFEIKAGHSANISNGQISFKKYWDLETRPCLDNIEEATENIRELVRCATNMQLISDVDVCTMLSGGLDSSILTKIANDNVHNLQTFSIDFLNNNNNFVANDYQMTKDSDYVKIMKSYLDTNHKTIEIDNSSLFELLEKSMIARDMPGMADIDASLFAFCGKISENGFKVCISGECSDEIFGGYPWYYKEHLLEHDGFPWALSEDLREKILKQGIFEKGNVEKYVKKSISDTLVNVRHLDEFDEFENKFRNTCYLTIKWFMNTLIERSDRMSMANSLEVRVPFADHRIFEYVYNLPAKFKLGIINEDSKPVEKYLLRKAFEKELPTDVVYRKKSPFPKTYDPVYLKLVEDKLQSILRDKNSKIHTIINTDFVQEILDIHGENLHENWFGQLMTYPQLLAYLIQIEMWLNTYNIEIEL